MTSQLLTPLAVAFSSQAYVGTVGPALDTLRMVVGLAEMFGCWSLNALDTLR